MGKFNIRDDNHSSSMQKFLDHKMVRNTSIGTRNQTELDVERHNKAMCNLASSVIKDICDEHSIGVKVNVYDNSSEFNVSVNIIGTIALNIIYPHNIISCKNEVFENVVTDFSEKVEQYKNYVSGNNSLFADDKKPACTVTLKTRNRYFK